MFIGLVHYQVKLDIDQKGGSAANITIIKTVVEVPHINKFLF